MNRQTPHLTHEQISNLLIADPTVCDLDLPQVESDTHLDVHLAQCAACRTELDDLRQSFAGFRDASILQSASLADAQARHALSARRALPRYRHLALWAASAAALVVAISAPIGNHLRHPVPAPAVVAQAPLRQPVTTYTAESDDALLTSIDQDLAASIPSSMQPLDNPLAATTSTSK